MYAVSTVSHMVIICHDAQVKFDINVTNLKDEFHCDLGKYCTQGCVSNMGGLSEKVHRVVWSANLYTISILHNIHRGPEANSSGATD